jgi:hypothetical protein
MTKQRTLKKSPMAPFVKGGEKEKGFLPLVEMTYGGIEMTKDRPSLTKAVLLKL